MLRLKLRRDSGLFFPARDFNFNNGHLIMDPEKLLLISFKGNILPMTKEEYESFLETIDEWNN